MSMAVKYGMKKRMAKGGDVKGVHNPRFTQGQSKAGLHAEGKRPMGVEASKKEHRKVLGEMQEMRGKDRTNLAMGGMATHANAGANAQSKGRLMTPRQPMAPAAGPVAAPAGGMAQTNARAQSKAKLRMYDGGEVTEPTIDPEKGKLVSDSFKKSLGFAGGGMVDRIMAKRCPPADEMPNEFDELELDPAPEDTSSAGNEIGDESLDDDDLVARIMRRRSA